MENAHDARWATGPARAGLSAGAALALALAAWAAATTFGGGESANVPKIPTFRSAPAPDAATPPPGSTSVAIAEASGGTSIDVSANTTTSAPGSQVDAVASVDQSTDASTTTDGTNSTSSTSSEQHVVVQHSDGTGSSSHSVEINRNESNTTVSSSPESDSSSATQIVNHSGVTSESTSTG